MTPSVPRSGAPVNGIWNSILRWTAFAVDGAWLALVAAWLAGRILGDRTIVLQWLSWIPTIGVLAVGFLWLACCAGIRRQPRWRRWAGVACVAIVGGAAIRSDYRPWPANAPSSPEDVRVLQWNTAYPSGNDPLSEKALAGIQADIFLISNRGSITAEDRVQAWAGKDFTLAGAGPFACITRFPIEEARTIAVGGHGRDLVWIVKFIVRPPAWNGRPLRIAMVDLPSKPSLSRAEVAQELVMAMQRGDLGDVDLVAGDFNSLPGSTVIERSFPAWHDSWEESGSGLRNSWPRPFALWSIDHVLLSRSMQATRSTTLDPGISMHRMNLLTLRPR